MIKNLLPQIPLRFLLLVSLIGFASCTSTQPRTLFIDRDLHAESYIELDAFKLKAKNKMVYVLFNQRKATLVINYTKSKIKLPIKVYLDPKRGYILSQTDYSQLSGMIDTNKIKDFFKKRTLELIPSAQLLIRGRAQTPFVEYRTGPWSGGHYAGEVLNALPSTLDEKASVLTLIINGQKRFIVISPN